MKEFYLLISFKFKKNRCNLNFIQFINIYPNYDSCFLQTHAFFVAQDRTIQVEDAEGKKTEEQKQNIRRIFTKHYDIIISDALKDPELRSKLINVVKKIEQDFDLDLSPIFKEVCLGKIKTLNEEGEEVVIPLQFNQVKGSPVLEAGSRFKSFSNRSSEALDLSSFSEEEWGTYQKHEDYPSTHLKDSMIELFSSLNMADCLINERLFNKLLNSLTVRLNQASEQDFFEVLNFAYQGFALEPRVKNLLVQSLRLKMLHSSDLRSFLMRLGQALDENAKNIDVLDLRGISISYAVSINASKAFPSVKSLKLSDPNIVTFFLPNHWLKSLEEIDVTGCSRLRSILRLEKLEQEVSLIGAGTTLLN